MIKWRDLPKRMRSVTVASLAMHLVCRVRELFGVDMVACLWVRRDSVYKSMPGCDCWDIDRDACLYPGPHPIIAHPPCGPWGVFKHVSRESTLDGEMAMRLVHHWGGVVEHPVGSSLFRCFAGDSLFWRNYGGKYWIEKINQVYFGFPTKKPTYLYWNVPT